jgi:hypothetical protein
LRANSFTCNNTKWSWQKHINVLKTGMYCIFYCQTAAKYEH